MTPSNLPTAIVPRSPQTDSPKASLHSKAKRSRDLFDPRDRSVYPFMILCIIIRYTLGGDAMLLTAKVLLTFVTLGYSAIPSLFDFNNTHATNPS